MTRNPRRTAATAAALMVGLALVSLVAILAASLKESAGQAVRESFLADLVVEVPQQGAIAGFSPEVTEGLSGLPEVEIVSPMRFGIWQEEGQMRFLAGIDPGSLGEMSRIEVSEGRFEDLSGRSVALTENAARERGLSVGDRLPMELARTGTVQLPVVAIYEPIRAMNFDFVISMQTYEQLFTNRLDNLVFVSFSQDADPAAARASVEAVTADHPNVVVRDQTELLAAREEQVDQLLALVTVLLLLAIVIALLGITNTLALSVFERTRELGLLRAVGMSRRQTRSMIRWEALVVALLGAVLGMLVGIVFGWAIVTALRDEGVTAFRLPPVQLAAYIAVAGLAGVLAGVFPARRAARLDVLKAIATE